MHYTRRCVQCISLHWAYRDWETRLYRDWETGEANLEMTTSKLVRTEKDAIEAAGVDLSIWYVHSWECRQ